MCIVYAELEAISRQSSPTCVWNIVCSTCHNLVSRVQAFLKLDERPAEEAEPQVLPVNKTTNDSSSDVLPEADEIAAVVASQSDDASSVASSEESFERVSATDLVEFEAAAANADIAPMDMPSSSPTDEDGDSGKVLVGDLSLNGADPLSGPL